MFTYQDVFGDKQTILFVMAHPDDGVVYYGALIHKLRDDKKNIFVLTVSNGARGSRDAIISEEVLSKVRREEELAALQYLGVPRDNFSCLGYADGEVEADIKLIGEISKYIRKYKADIVCTHEPTAIYQSTYAKDGFFIQHRDHRKVAEAVVDAVYPFSRDRSFFPEHGKEGILPHSVFHIVMTDEVQSNFEIDYTDAVEIKKSALRLYKSQMNEDFINDVVNAVKFNNKYLEKYFYMKLLW